MRGICGYKKASDALINVDLSVGGRTVEIESKLKGMFGKSMEKAVFEVLNEMKVEDVHVKVQDFGALDFVIKARTRSAIKMARGEV
jgi:citrate lyase subunit gamma (acyl carrier protein)